MMLSAPFFCALHANSTRAFPQILDISSGTNVCGGVHQCKRRITCIWACIAHLLTLYALNERPSSSKGAMIDASPCKQDHGRSSSRFLAQTFGDRTCIMLSSLNPSWTWRSLCIYDWHTQNFLPSIVADLCEVLVNNLK